jgi:5-formyltetrahydrofolate cyclo-ligase
MAWRRATRAELLARRQAVAAGRAAETAAVVADLVGRGVPGLTTACVGFYWPFRGELDLRPLAADVVARGARAALPAVVARAQPVEFRAWTPGMTLAPDAVGIPAPPPGAATRPAILLVPLLGFDEAGYRLGYGGGYYDRTLAALGRKPLVVGVGYALGRLPTIRPQPHDVAMDAIATEDGLDWFPRAGAKLRRIEGGADDDSDEAGYASPPCFLHELDPSVLGYLSREETIELLGALRGALRGDAHARAMLGRHIVRLDGAPAEAAPAGEESAILSRLRAALPRLYDESLAADLGELLRDRAAGLASDRP